MSLINCKECNKEVSDTAKTCPHCGYKLKQLKLSLKVENKDIIILGLLIQSFLLMFINGTFTTHYNSWGDRIVSRISNASFLDSVYNIFSISDIILIILGIVSILSILIKTFNKYDLKILNKIKNNIYICNLPTIIYCLTALILTICIIFGLDVVDYETSKRFHCLEWGGIWMNILLIASTVILVGDFIINKKRKVK